MKIETKFDVGGNIFCLDKYGNIKERKIFGIRTQGFINGSQKTIYSFVKDGVVNADFTGEMPPIYAKDDFFWLPEDKVYASKDELKDSL
ncbi:hypothetical protein [Dysgonomonas capnocytophagoides]|uniref:hypothetical protein n=1 Tax=Dysgonomonas capnocytophagoides TaxID=45254 RepID=UPI002923A2D5|nr:hypothetical protein DCPSUM001_33530 [Dysgonomonas capnocytophagoides]